MNKLLLAFILVISLGVQAQKKSFKVSILAFYNLENLYDTLDDPKTNDEEFTPAGPRNYSSNIYWNKIDKLATVLSKLGTDEGIKWADGASVIGVAEVENESVIKDLVNHKLLKSRNYNIVHYNSKDIRGVDVAFLYNPKYFEVIDSKPLFVKLPSGAKDSYFTRDVLWVKGKLDGEIVHIYVNHWPSRLGGEERSAPGRAAAAAVCKMHSDSIQMQDGEQKIVIMGDLNDDPTSPSLTQVLKTKGNISDVKSGGLFNPWVDLYKSGIGTLAYQDAWGLFDQIIISKNGSIKNKMASFFKKHTFLTENF